MNIYTKYEQFSAKGRIMRSKIINKNKKYHRVLLYPIVVKPPNRAIKNYQRNTKLQSLVSAAISQQATQLSCTYRSSAARMISHLPSELQSHFLLYSKET